MKKVLGLFFIALLLILNSITLYKYLANSKEISAIKSNYEENLTKNEEQLKIKEKTHTNLFIVENENENLNLRDDLKLITIEGDTIFAKNAFKSSSIVLRYSVLNCGDCVNAEFKNLEMYAKKFSKQITIITYYKRIRGLIMDYKKLQKQGLDNITMYMLPDNKLDIPLENHNIPYYFHINPDLRINNVFIPLKEQPRLSEYYLKYSFKNFFSQQ